MRVQLGDATQNKTYYDLSSRPLAYTLADCTLFQADYGFRDGLPTFMALAVRKALHVHTHARARTRTPTDRQTDRQAGRQGECIINLNVHDILAGDVRNLRCCDGRPYLGLVRK
jgi:hypothetical protein